jgi:hypothetical protein
MLINKVLLNLVSDADLHTKYETIEYSTSLREIITVGYMMDHPQD